MSIPLDKPIDKEGNIYEMTCVAIKEANIISSTNVKDEIEESDIIAIVAPIHIQQQFLKLAGSKPVIMAVNDRVFVKQPDGSEDKVEFRFVKWSRLVKIEVVKEDYVPGDL